MSPPTCTPSNKDRPARRRLLACLGWMGLGGVLVVAAIAAGALVIIETGEFDATAITPHREVVGWATHTTMIRSMQRRARGVQAPARFSAAQIEAGLRLYDTHCAMCHGAPGAPRASWTTGMTPTPPFLLDAARRWTPAQLQVIVADGVKMTAMPAWSTTLSPDEIWDIVAFLEGLPGVSATEYAEIRSPAAQGGQAQLNLGRPSRMARRP